MSGPTARSCQWRSSKCAAPQLFASLILPKPCPEPRTRGARGDGIRRRPTRSLTSGRSVAAEHQAEWRSAPGRLAGAATRLRRRAARVRWSAKEGDVDFNNILIGSEDPERLAAFYTKLFGEPTFKDESYSSWRIGSGVVSIGPHSEVKGRNTSPGRIIWNI